MISQSLRELLVDPEDKGELIFVESDSVLYNPRLRRSYPVKGDIPVMLVSDSTQVDDDTHTRYTSQPK